MADGLAEQIAERQRFRENVRRLVKMKVLHPVAMSESALGIKKRLELVQEMGWVRKTAYGLGALTAAEVAEVNRKMEAYFGL